MLTSPNLVSFAYMLSDIKTNSCIGEVQNIISLLMMILQPELYAPKSASKSWSKSEFVSQPEVKKEAKFCKKLASTVALAILPQVKGHSPAYTALHNDLMKMLSKEGLGVLTKVHFDKAKELLSLETGN